MASTYALIPSTIDLEPRICSFFSPSWEIALQRELAKRPRKAEPKYLKEPLARIKQMQLCGFCTVDLDEPCRVQCHHKDCGGIWVILEKRDKALAAPTGGFYAYNFLKHMKENHAQDYDEFHEQFPEDIPRRKGQLVATSSAPSMTRRKRRIAEKGAKPAKGQYRRVKECEVETSTTTSAIPESSPKRMLLLPPRLRKAATELKPARYSPYLQPCTEAITSQNERRQEPVKTDSESLTSGQPSTISGVRSPPRRRSASAGTSSTVTVVEDTSPDTYLLRKRESDIPLSDAYLLLGFHLQPLSGF